MPYNRYFCRGPFVQGLEVFLETNEFHHLRHVSRSRCGDEVELINGTGELASSVICQLSKESATIKITSVHKELPPHFTLTLALAFLKPSHLEYAIEKATEVGVSQFWLFAADRSEKRQISDQYLKRLQHIVLGATKQCGRLFMPELHVKKNLASCCLGEEQLLFGDLSSETKPLSQIGPLSSRICLFIGPESGFSPNEKKSLLAAKASSVSFHPNILRAETAAVVGPALLFKELYSLC